MELYTKIATAFQSLNIFSKSSILDFRLGSKYTSDIMNDLFIFLYYELSIVLRLYLKTRSR